MSEPSAFIEANTAIERFKSSSDDSKRTAGDYVMSALEDMDEEDINIDTVISHSKKGLIGMIGFLTRHAVNKVTLINFLKIKQSSGTLDEIKKSLNNLRIDELVNVCDHLIDGDHDD